MELVVAAAVEVVERHSLKLRVKLLRALEEANVRSVAVEVQLVKLKSRSVSGGKKVSSSIASCFLVLRFLTVKANGRLRLYIKREKGGSVILETK